MVAGDTQDLSVVGEALVLIAVAHDEASRGTQEFFKDLLRADITQVDDHLRSTLAEQFDGRSCALDRTVAVGDQADDVRRVLIHGGSPGSTPLMEAVDLG